MLDYKKRRRHNCRTNARRNYDRNGSSLCGLQNHVFFVAVGGRLAAVLQLCPVS